MPLNSATPIQVDPPSGYNLRGKAVSGVTYRGTVRHGVVVLEGGVTLDEGTPVEVRAVAVARASSPAGAGTIWEEMAAVRGTVDGFPADAARNLDHYLYGLQKRDE
jgi:hypothetical protein